MPKFLRLSVAVLLFAAAALTTRPAAANMPTCFNLPKYNYPSPFWQYSHQCHEGTQIWYVYIDFRGKWYLTSTNVLP